MHIYVTNELGPTPSTDQNPGNDTTQPRQGTHTAGTHTAGVTATKQRTLTDNGTRSTQRTRRTDIMPHQTPTPVPCTARGTIHKITRRSSTTDKSTKLTSIGSTTEYHPTGVHAACNGFNGVDSDSDETVPKQPVQPTAGTPWCKPSKTSEPSSPSVVSRASPVPRASPAPRASSAPRASAAPRASPASRPTTHSRPTTLHHRRNDIMSDSSDTSTTVSSSSASATGTRSHRKKDRSHTRRGTHGRSPELTHRNSPEASRWGCTCTCGCDAFMDTLWTYTNYVVETRDTEIDRLSRLLEGGRPYDVVALESRNRSNERLISHLNIQVDYLQQKNHDLQLQADAALSKATTAASHTMEADIKNTELNHELQTVDRMAQQLQLDKDSVVRSADMQLSDVNVELHKARDELENMDLQIAQFRAENDRLRIDNSDLKSQLSSEQVNRDTMDGLLQRVQDDKHKLGRRINKLLANEKELVLEIDRLKHRTSCGTKKKSAKTPNRVEALLKSVEQERDYWKGEVDILQKISSSRALSPSRSPSRTRSPTRARSPVRSTAKSPVRSRNASPLRSSIEKYESTIRLIEDERDHFKRECELMKSARSTSPSRLSKSYSEDLGELSRVMKERDELQVMLNKFERHMSEIQTNVKVLTSERDKVSILYEETREELARLRRDVVRSPKSPKTSLAAQAVLRRVENERDDSLNELRRTATERDSLRERLKLATETQLADRARLEQRIEELELITRTAERERSEQLGHSDLLRTRVNDVETELNEQRHQSSSAKDEVVQQKATATQMRLLAEQAEHALEDSQFRLTRKEVELRNVEEKLVLLEQRVAELSQTNQSERNAGTQLKATISSLDREKDSLQICIDEKTENIVILDNEIALKEATITELRATIADIESSLMRAQDVVVSKDHEIASLRRQVDGTTGDLSETVRSRDVALRENRRLQDDLANMTRENQNVNADLQESLVERERLKTQVQEYIGEVKRTEELLAAKDLERNDILEQYRALSLEAEKFETHNHQLESEGSNLRLELMTRENESRRLRERIDLLERDIKELMHTERSYEVQVNSMTKTVATLEDSVRCIDNDKHTLMQDVSAVRDLCTQLEATKDSLQRQLTGATLDREKLQSMLDDSRREAEVLRSQMSTERTSMKNLEHLLSSEREREFHTQLSQQEQSAEIQLLRDRLMLNDTKMETQGRDLTTARSQIMELESEVERVKRQLTNERFERERAAHELRRHGLSPVDTSARLSRLSAGSPSAISPLRNRSRSPSHRSPLRSPLDNNALQSI